MGGNPQKRGLTPKQRRFVQEYLKDLNATKAATRAGYSAKTAEHIGYQLLQKTTVQEQIQKAQEKIAAKSEKTVDDIVRELTRLAFSNMSEYVEFGGKKGLVIKDISEMGEDAKRCVSEVSITKSKGGGRLAFKLYDKVKALELLGRYLGAEKPRKHELTGKDGGPIKMAGGLTPETVDFLRKKVLGIEDAK